MKGVLASIVFALAASLIAALLLCAGIGLCLAALYLWLAGLFAVPVAAAITGGTMLALLACAYAAAALARRWRSAAPGGRAQGRPHGGGDSATALGAAAARWIRSNAKMATLAALIAGLIAGASPELRQAVKKLLREMRSG